MATMTDPGKLIKARLPGSCAECGGDIQPNDTIYFSRLHGSRHKRCVEPAEPAATAADERDATPAGPTAAPRAAPRDDWLWADGERDATPRAARDGAAARDGGAARDTEFGRAGDRDAARRELGQVLDLLIESQEKHTEALRRVRKLLS